jgi:hypothetical protein
MRSSPRLPRAAATALVTALAAAGVLAAGATNATTAPTPTATPISIRAASWAGIDSLRPNSTITTGDARVGAWKDRAGRVHMSKAYFTFDISQFHGTDVQSVSFFAAELAVADCTKPRATEAWRTRPAANPTWNRQPRELTKLPGPGALGCPWPYVEWDATAAVRDAVAAGKNTVTLALRMAENRQDKPAFGRTYATDPGLDVVYNTPPDTPTNLRVGTLFGAQHPCTTADMFIGGNPINVGGDVSDPDGDADLSARVAFWAVDDPAARQEVVTSAFGDFRAEFPADLLRDGETYAWQARTEDRDGAVSAWSEPCQFTLDRTRPDAVPTVESTDFPEGTTGGGDGVPGEFTFTANGVPDVAGFVWSSIGTAPRSVDADRLGGSATVTFTPTDDGPNEVRVASFDRAGNRSDQRTYRFFVRATAPHVSVVAGQVGEPVTATFTAVQDGATTFIYQVDDGAESSVPVGADGTAEVDLDVPPGEPFFHSVTVWTVNGAGQRSGENEAVFVIDAVQPQVEVSPDRVLLGESTEITFRPTMAGVASYTYWIDSGERTVVPAAADGTARINHAWTESGGHQISAFSTNAAGADSGVGFGTVFVDDGAPEITSEDYPRNSFGGGPGIAGTFNFSSPLAGVTEFRYTLSGQEEKTVAAAPDGTTSVELRPTESSLNHLDVYAVTSTGLTSGVASYTFYVNGLEPLVTGPTEPVPVGQPVEFHLTAQLPGTTEFVYRSFTGEPRVAPAVDGEATVTITANNDTGTGEGYLFVLSRTGADGYSSAETSATYQVTS